VIQLITIIGWVEEPNWKQRRRQPSSLMYRSTRSHWHGVSYFIFFDGFFRITFENRFNLVLDEDVLDTWFSSALFPFSIFGWPDEVYLMFQLIIYSALMFMHNFRRRIWHNSIPEHFSRRDMIFYSFGSQKWCFWHKSLPDSFHLNRFVDIFR
jgi:hypothetical protein